MEEAGITRDHLLDGGKRLSIVGIFRNADPILSEIDTVDFVAQQRLPNMGSEVAYAGDCPQVVAKPCYDPFLFDHRTARLCDPVDQEVSLLERGKERLAQCGYDEQANQHDRTRGDEHRAWMPDDRPEHFAVSMLQASDQRLFPVLDRYIL